MRRRTFTRLLTLGMVGCAVLVGGGIGRLEAYGGGDWLGWGLLLGGLALAGASGALHRRW